MYPKGPQVASSQQENKMPVQQGCPQGGFAQPSPSQQPCQQQLQHQQGAQQQQEWLAVTVGARQGLEHVRKRPRQYALVPPLQHAIIGGSFAPLAATDWEETIADETQGQAKQQHAQQQAQQQQKTAGAQRRQPAAAAAATAGGSVGLRKRRAQQVEGPRGQKNKQPRQQAAGTTGEEAEQRQRHCRWQQQQQQEQQQQQQSTASASANASASGSSSSEEAAEQVTGTNSSASSEQGEAKSDEELDELSDDGPSDVEEEEAEGSGGAGEEQASLAGVSYVAGCAAARSAESRVVLLQCFNVVCAASQLYRCTAALLCLTCLHARALYSGFVWLRYRGRMRHWRPQTPTLRMSSHDLAARCTASMGAPPLCHLGSFQAATAAQRSRSETP
jgi:hypothetical protein